MRLLHSDRLRELGGPGSGNFGHAGIPGQRGGSAPKGSGGGGESKGKAEPKQKESKMVKSGFTEEGHYGSGEFSEDDLKLVDTYKDNSANLNGALIKGTEEYSDSIKKLDNVY